MPQRLLFALAAAFTLGLAPFAPEPHIVGKIRWLLGGGEGMQPQDWFDLVFHGAPWVWLLVEVGFLVRSRMIRSRMPRSKE